MDLKIWIHRGPATALVLIGMAAAFIATEVQAQANRKIAEFAATAVPARDPAAAGVRIDLLRWSSDEDRARLAAAFAESRGEAGAEAFVQALGAAETLGYLWTVESAGYPIRYAHRTPAPDGGEQVVLVVPRRFGSWNPALWSLPPAGEDGAGYTLVELRLDGAGRGEGRSSLGGGVAAAEAALGLEHWDQAAVLLTDVHRTREALD